MARLVLSPESCSPVATRGPQGLVPVLFLTPQVAGSSRPTLYVCAGVVSTSGTDAMAGCAYGSLGPEPACPVSMVKYRLSAFWVPGLMSPGRGGPRAI